MGETNGTYLKPLPLIIDEDNVAYWESTKRHAMEIQKCSSCGEWRFYPSPVCPNCSSTEHEWREIGGYGTVYTYSVVYRPPSAAFADDVPYAYAIVELDEGPMFPTSIVGVDPEQVHIGMRVKILYDDVTPEITLPRFEPIGAAGA
jgi:uncharacterized OB-fold protein